MTDEEVIRRRLLIDGYGTGDDRRLNTLIRTIMKWCSIPSSNTHENQNNYDKMLGQLKLCEYSVQKSSLTKEMIIKELEMYENACQVIKANIESVKLNIDVHFSNLTEAKTVRKNKMEYDMLAKVIREQPDRKKTVEHLNELLAQLTALEEKSKELEKKLDSRGKQFYVLIASATELRNLLTLENDDIMDTSLDMDDLPDTEIQLDHNMSE